MENVCMIQKERFIVSQKVLFWKHSRQKEADTIRTNVSQPLYGEGRWSFVMERRQKNGEAAGEVKENRNFI